MNILDFITNQVLRELSIFLGLVTLIGCLFLKKTFNDTLVSTVKTIVGIRILQLGSNTLVEASKPMLNMLIARTGLEGRVADAWLGVGEAMQQMAPGLAAQIGLLMIGAWLLHLLLARVTPFKVIYLTMHVAFVDSVLILWGVSTITGWSDARATLMAGVLLALNWTVLPAILRPLLKGVVGKEEVTLGHDVMVGSMAAMAIARIAGKSRSAEELPLPGWLSIFKDNSVAYAVVMAIIYTLIGVISGPEAGARFSNGNHYLMFSFMQGITAAAGLLVLVTGVKMSMSELLPAFKGFAGIIVPGAVAAVDIPVFISYRPQAALVGFMATLGGMATGILLQVSLHLNYITIPSVLPIFFGGSMFGVVADEKAGWRGVLLSCFILGIVFILGSALYAQVTNLKLAAAGNIDYVLLWLPLFSGMRLIFGK